MSPEAVHMGAGERVGTETDWKKYVGRGII